MADFEPKVFLGGSCGTSVWRNDVMYRLSLEELPFFNPQKAEGEWRMEDMELEEQEKEASKVHYNELLLLSRRPCRAKKILEIYFLQLCKALLFVIEDERSLYSMIEVAFLVSFFFSRYLWLLCQCQITQARKNCFRVVIASSLPKESYLFSHIWTSLKGSKFDNCNE